MDLDNVANPYDFANPVGQKALFSGREKELDEIKYYLDQARRANHPINIAALGARAAGKTSLLNMIDIKATEHGFCTVRIDLNEGDVESQAAFFYKVFDSLISVVANTPRRLDENEERPRATVGSPLAERCFGGPHGQVYHSYLLMASMFQVPDDKTWCPFMFPIQYAMAMGAGREDVRISDQNFKRDLRTIAEEVRRPIALLFDECNVLSSRRILLEMLRNIFMNMPRYFLVFTGTPDLFPVMDDVFSPIVRQFKKIEVGAFDSFDDARACMERPLRSIGIDQPRRYLPISTVLEVAKLTGRRPYEIQLLSHFMFRRMQKGAASRMQLNLDVLDDVLVELGTGHDLAARPSIQKVRNLETEELEALRILTSCDGRATFDQLWACEYLFSGQDCDKTNLANHRGELVRQGLLREDRDGLVSFSGDDFDRIYAKYYAAQRNVTLSFVSLPPAAHTLMYLERTFMRHGFQSLTWRGLRLRPLDTDGDPRVGTAFGSHRITAPYRLDEVVRGLRFLGEPDQLAAEDPLIRIGSSLLIDAFAHARSEVCLYEVHLDLPWCTDSVLFVEPVGEYGDHTSIRGVLRSVGKRAAELGGSIELEHAAVPVPAVEEVVTSLSSSDMASNIAKAELETATMDYLNGHKETARRRSNLALQISMDVPATDLNNVGYMHLVAREYEAALKLLEEAETREPENEVRPLISYNMALACLLLGKREAAKEHFSKARERHEQRSEQVGDYSVLLVAVMQKGQLSVQEREEPSMGAALESFAEVLRGDEQSDLEFD